MRMKKCMLIGLICLLSSQWMWGQHFPQMDARNYVSDTALFIPRRPWLAASEVFGMNMAVWTFDRFLMNEDFAKINGHTIKQNFKTGPVWDTDKFSTNLVAHPYHGSLYFNAARSNGLNFWQSIPFAAGGSLMWEFFMETERPSINDMLATSFGGIELGEITYRLSDLFIDNRSHGAERVGREILSGLISPMRAINRIITGEAWRHSSSKGRVYTSVPVNFIVGVGPRFLAEQEGSKHGTTSMHVSFRLDYGDPFNDDFYSPYEWFQLKAGFDFFSSQPLISQVNAVGAIWGKQVWSKGPRSLAAGIFQHFDYYDSELKSNSSQTVAPYRISEAAAVGGGLIYYKRGIRYTGEQTLCNSIFNRILCPMAFGIRKYCVSLYLNAVVAEAAICIQTEMREEIIPDHFGYFRHVGMRRIFNYSIAEQGNILIVVIFVRGETSVYCIFCLTQGTVVGRLLVQCIIGSGRRISGSPFMCSVPTPGSASARPRWRIKRLGTY